MPDIDTELDRVAVCFEPVPSLDRPSAARSYSPGRDLTIKTQYKRIIGVDVSSEKLDVNDSITKSKSRIAVEVPNTVAAVSKQSPDRKARRRGSSDESERQVGQKTYNARRAFPGTMRALHGNTLRDKTQQIDQTVLRPIGGKRQTQGGCIDSCDAKTADHSQRHGTQR